MPAEGMPVARRVKPLECAHVEVWVGGRRIEDLSADERQAVAERIRAAQARQVLAMADEEWQRMQQERAGD